MLKALKKFSAGFLRCGVRPKLRFGYRTFLVILILLPMGYTLYKEWQGVRASLEQIRWLQLSIGLVVLMIAQPFMGLISWVILRNLKARQPFLKVMGLYFVSQVAKYLPGGIWAFPGRMVAYQAVGVERSSAIVSVAREVTALFLGASSVGLLGLLQGLPIPEWVSLSIAAGVLACVVAIILMQTPWFWRTLSRIKFLKSSTLAAVVGGQNRASLAWLPGSLIVSLGFWGITGIAFYYLTLAVSPEAIKLTWLQAASVFALSWCAGFVVVFAPAGLGVRESAMSLMLLFIMPLSQALSVALLARVWWTFADAFYIIVSVAWFGAAVKPEGGWLRVAKPIDRNAV